MRELLKCCCYDTEAPSSRQLGHEDANTRCSVYLFSDFSVFFFPAAFQAVEELLESLELEKSSYHMGLSKVSTTGPSGASASPETRRRSAAGHRGGALLHSGQQGQGSNI